MKQRVVLSCAVVLIAALAALWGCADKPTDSNITGRVGGVGFTGAIFTTDIGCGQTNINLYASKDDVYLNGGPQGGGSGLPDGSYFVKVTDPSGATVLGKTLNAAVTVSGGKFIQCYRLVLILYSGTSGFTVQGYDDTPNNGDEYKVWVSATADFVSSKTDNFKVKADGGTTTGSLCVYKFYDANANGIDDDIQPILGWKVSIGSDIYFTPQCIVDAPGAYTVTEFLPNELNWIPTTDVVQTATIISGATTDVKFGNVCLGAGGGLTLGFWSNKNGQFLFGADDLAAMVALNLRNANGTAFDPASYSAFRTWILGANATNMAYMLSAQLAAMKLNILNGKVSGGAIVYVPGCGGFMTVNALVAAADAELGLHGYVVSGDPDRAKQECLKNALDKANNNLNFVQANPCSFTF